ncbi:MULTISPECIES: acetolactate synthase large subunit [unclassified Microcystis]|jgi:acetolactate synthase-1/2/3 large subunit|uniref:Acetolactate synthase large subunit n=1 Tax=Microcystis flos-aquae Mf_QC_C_20070823_S10D TaxID=2486236 RepID=A0A552L840_9CHRO|nr:MULTISPECIES: acetolactate synthase large subunit [unclassified Microcystis]MCA2817226.1 acetolactate synthase large subunit [Microcystis sp. M085S1]MCA2855311.1 acetolactate synthase large subunit [Microcystis sp. M065S1]TRT79778.1 MAG: acetolactate synthase large subunit [Microcystis flos-aquae Ma_QC_C_20070823_S18]TRU02645.1 MAG: acetolactate synthase large subunit [Microcystis flos-aquae Ma_QC_C_20070823_S18D]TRV16309.1 MAG: acetolactate synthase large subunit [Microcystis flos-aquae Mf
MGELNTAELLVKCLENEGVEYIFGLPGEENLDVLEALKNSSIKFITTRHEQGAAFMADVYGRLTGKAGVCLSTLGPGATNLMTGVADANLDGAPLVAITGQVGTDRMHIESHQYLDLVAMFAPVTKWNKQIVRPGITPEVVRRAFKTAQSEKPGAVHIDLPENIAAMAADGSPLPLDSQEKVYASYRTLNMAAAVISKAKNPLILAGNGAIRANASEALTEFATALNIPVANTFMGKGVIPYTHPLALWAVGLQQRDLISCAFDRSDLIIAVGYDLIEYSPKKWNPEGKLPIIHIGMTPAEIDSSYAPVVEVVGDITDSLIDILKRADRQNKPTPVTAALKTEIRADYETYANDTGFPIKPQKLIYDLRQVMGPEDIAICDVGAHKMWMARHYHSDCPNTCIISNGFAAMGIAIPGAIAAKLVYPDKRVVAVTGDGGFMMNCQELETALRVGTPFVTLIFNDGGYGLIEWKQLNYFGTSSFIKFGNPDFVKFAESMGLKGYRVESTQDLIPTLEDAFRQDVPTVIDVPVDYGENLRLSQKSGDLSCQIWE